MIIATAGHIDHGKTSLVKVLSGIDTDRLPEEKKRGLSIDIGFAYAPAGTAVLGFVDVPGHERFVRNMIAGVSGIDRALLVIAADDGVMPQTREHLAILDLLGVSQGVVALTKTDRVDRARIASVQADIAELLADTELAGAPVFPVSSVTGDGIAALREHLAAEAQGLAAARASGSFRMSIDRAFIIEGAGIVVTGLVLSGEVKIGNKLLIAPEGIEVRVRGIHAQNSKADQGRAGERCAINITAQRLTLNDIKRGDWLLDAAIHAPTDRFDARIRLLSSEASNLRHWTPAHLHIGAADIPARIAVLQDQPLAPGEEAFVQIVLPHAISALHGDRFVLRDQSATRTIAGGAVIDPFAPDRGRARPARIAQVAALERGHFAAALGAALAVAPEGLPFGAFCQSRNTSPEHHQAVVQALKAIVVGEGRDALAFSLARWSDILNEAQKVFEVAQKQDTGSPDLTLVAVQQKLSPRVRRQAVQHILNAMTKSGTLEHLAGAWRLAGSSAQLSDDDTTLWKRIEPLLDDENLRPPSVAEIAGELNQEARIIERFLNRAARIGLVVQVAANRYYLPQRLRQLGEIAEKTASDDPAGLLVVRAYRDRSGIGRNLVIEVLEFFDRLGFTRRSGEHRRIIKPAADVAWVRTAR